MIPGRKHGLVLRSVIGVLGLVALCGPWVTPVQAARESDRLMRQRALAWLETGSPGEALAAFDSLLVEDLSNLGAGYLAAVAESRLNRPGRARCRWLEVEVVARGREVGRLARSSRRRLEQTLADRQLALGAAWFSTESLALTTPGLVLLPLESLGGDADAEYYGLAWSYLLFDALRGSRLCPAPMPSALLALDLVTSGRGVRLPSGVASQPLNTVGGLRGRLALLPSGLGGGVLESSAGSWDDPLREALRFFQQTQGLAVTGEADPETQRRLETVSRAWLESPPPALAPQMLARVLSVLGSTRAVRGTYRIEDGEVRVQISVVDSAGDPTHPNPILLDFPLDETAVQARRAAAEIARLAGGSLSEWNHGAEELGFGRWSTAARARLVFDRGLPRMETRRWEELPEQVREWEPLSGHYSDALWEPLARERVERDWRRSWISESALDRYTAHDAFQWGMNGGGDAFVGPSSTRIVGTLGRIRIRGVRP